MKAGITILCIGAIIFLVAAAGILTKQARQEGEEATSTEMTNEEVATSTPQDEQVLEATTSIKTKIGEGAGAHSVTVLPLRVVEDSRCPEGAECIWTGTVKLEAQLTSGLGTSTMEFELGKPTTTESELVTLIAVAPVPQVGQEIAEHEYDFYFSIEKRSE